MTPDAPDAPAPDSPKPRPHPPKVALLSRIARVLVFGVALGAVASLFAIGFVDTIQWLNDALFVTLHSRESIAPQSRLSMLLFVLPAIGGLGAGLLILLIPDRRPQNPSDFIQAAQSGKGVSPRAGWLTAAAVVVGLGSGASVGQYGPLTHLGATIGTLISRLTRVEPSLGIGCGVAAVISTAFNAPIAGIIFAHEVVLRHYSLRAFAPITVASSTGLFIADRIFHRPPLLEMSVSRSVFAPEFLAFVLIGVGGALVAILYMQGILSARRLSERLGLPVWLKPAIAGLGVGVAAQWIPEILGVGQGTLRAAITPGAYDAAGLGVVLVAKIAATALCIGFGFAGGVFSPALLIGILFGALLGSGAEFLYGDFYSGLEFYAICGMAAVTSPVIGAPLATILIVFELTRNYELTTAVMVSVVFSNLVAYRLFGRSLFDRELSLRGFDLSLGRDKATLDQTSIGEYITADFIRVHPDDDLSQIRRMLAHAERNRAYLVDDDSTYLGMITLGQTVADDPAASSSRADAPAAQSPAGGKARDHARDDSLRFSAEMSLWEAMEAMEAVEAVEGVHGIVGESVPVIAADGRLLGVVYESTLVKAYLQTVRRLRVEENAAQ